MASQKSNIITHARIGANTAGTPVHIYRKQNEHAHGYSYSQDGSRDGFSYYQSATPDGKVVKIPAADRQAQPTKAEQGRR